MEAVKEHLESGDVTRGTGTDHAHGFEPEILAFCCEH
jgi:hypothetical protein